MLSACASRIPTPCRQLFILLAIFSLGFFIIASAHAATYYVATTGSDSNPGTQAAPFRTIAKGSQRLASGDTLYIRAGTYNEAMVSGQDGFTFRNGTPSAYTRYAAAPGDEGKVLIRPSSGSFVAWFSKNANYIELSGLVLDGTNANSYNVKLDGDFDTTHASHIRILNNEIRNGRMGIGGGGDSEIIGNEIHHMDQYGIYTAFNNGLLERNIFHDNGGYGIHLFQQDPAPSHRPNNWVIRNNVFFNNGNGFGTANRKAPAVIISRGNNTQFYNNLVHNNHAGVFVGYGASDTLVANNTVYGNKEYGLDVNSAYLGSKNARIVNNIVWGNGRSQITNNATNTTLQNNLTEDPKFVNPTAGDFGIQTGSPAIDKGVTLAEVPKDFTGKNRPEGAGYDIGAFEGAGSQANAVPGGGTVIGFPPGGGSFTPGAPVLLGPNGEVCHTGYLPLQ